MCKEVVIWNFTYGDILGDCGTLLFFGGLFFVRNEEFCFLTSFCLHKLRT